MYKYNYKVGLEDFILEIKDLTLKAPITTAADDMFFNIFPSFRKNKV